MPLPRCARHTDGRSKSLTAHCRHEQLATTRRRGESQLSKHYGIADHAVHGIYTTEFLEYTVTITARHVYLYLSYWRLHPAEGW